MPFKISILIINLHAILSLFPTRRLNKQKPTRVFWVNKVARAEISIEKRIFTLRFSVCMLGSERERERLERKTWFLAKLCK
jgi:hypothetical protein